MEKLIHISPEQSSNEDKIGSHQSVTDAIASLILTLDEGLAIGLEGDWGSGKSSIIRLLAEKIKEQKDITLFYYDAWKHEGDHLRRAFLSELIEHILQKRPEWFHSNSIAAEWRKQKDTLNKATDITEAFPEITWNAQVLAVLGLFVMPFGMPLLQMALNKTTKGFIGVPWPVPSLEIQACLLAFSPLLFYLGCAIPALWQRKGLPVFFGASGPTGNKSNTIRTPQPSSVEFERRFKDLINAVFRNAEAAENRKLVMVIDNLDRVDSETALTVWSTLQTFFDQGNHSNKEDYSKRLWLVVPYAQEGLEKLWPEAQEEADPLVNNFLEKTFDVRFYVPPASPVQHRHYLQRHLKEVISELQDDRYAFVLNDVCTIFTDFLKNRQRALSTPLITLRATKQFVHDLAGSYLVWKYAMPNDVSIEQLPQIGFFVLLKKYYSNQDIVRLIIQPNSEHSKKPYCPTILRELPDLGKNLASLLLNRERDEAMGLLLKQHLLEILGTPDDTDDMSQAKATRLKQAKNNERFWETLLICISDDGVNKASVLSILQDSILLDEEVSLDGRQFKPRCLNKLDEAVQVYELSSVNRAVGEILVRFWHFQVYYAEQNTEESRNKKLSDYLNSVLLQLDICAKTISASDENVIRDYAEGVSIYLIGASQGEFIFLDLLGAKVENNLFPSLKVWAYAIVYVLGHSPERMNQLEFLLRPPNAWPFEPWRDIRHYIYDFESFLSFIKNQPIRDWVRDSEKKEGVFTLLRAISKNNASEQEYLVQQTLIFIAQQLVELIYVQPTYVDQYNALKQLVSSTSLPQLRRDFLNAFQSLYANNRKNDEAIHAMFVNNEPFITLWQNELGKMISQKEAPEATIWIWETLIFHDNSRGLGWLTTLAESSSGNFNQYPEESRQKIRRKIRSKLQNSQVAGSFQKLLNAL